MELESSALSALSLGFLLGLKHATDADHVVAVSSIASEHRNAWRGIWVGASWGLGHSTPLIVLGTFILVFKEILLGTYEMLAPMFEFGVAVMLVFLGMQVFWKLRRNRLHVHEHAHDGDRHVHIHGSHDSSKNIEKDHGYFHFGKPVFRFKSFTIGIVHGLAGSAAVTLVLLPAMPSFWIGFGYLFLFGIGTILAMAIITIILGVPFALTKATSKWSFAVSGAAGTASLVLGFALASDVALNTTFIPF